MVAVSELALWKFSQYIKNRKRKQQSRKLCFSERRKFKNIEKEISDMKKDTDSEPSFGSCIEKDVAVQIHNTSSV